MKKIVSLFLSMILFVSCLATNGNVVHANELTSSNSEVSTLASSDTLVCTNTVKLPDGGNKFAYYEDAEGTIPYKGDKVQVSVTYLGTIEGTFIKKFKVDSYEAQDAKTIYVKAINGYELDSVTVSDVLGSKYSKNSTDVDPVAKTVTVKAPTTIFDIGDKIDPLTQIAWGSDEDVLCTGTVDVSLAKVNFTVNATECVVNGNTEVEKNANESTTFTIVANAGFGNPKVTVNGEKVEITGNQFTVSNATDGEINVVCTKVKKFTTYNVSIEGNGSLKDVNDTTIDVEEGTGQTIQAIAKKGSYLKEVTLNGQKVEVAKDGTFTINYKDENTYDLKVVFDSTSLVLKNSEYTLKYNGSIDINDELYQKLYSDLIDLELSSSDLPVNYDENSIQVLYEYEIIFGFKGWKELDSSFGKNEVEKIKFKFNDVESEEISVTFEDARIESSIAFNEDIKMAYTKDAETFKNCIYSNINFETSILPANLTQDDFKYYFEVNLYDILSSTLGVDGLDEILASTGMLEDTIIEQLKQSQFVDVDESTTIGQMIDKYPLADTIKKLLGDEICNQSVMPSVGNRNVKVAYAGNKEYKAVEAQTAITIVKATSSITVNDTSIVYGQSIPSNLVVCNPSDVNKLVLYIGMDTNLKGFVSIDLPNGLIYKALEELYPDGFTLEQLTDVLEALNIAINSEDLEKILAQIPDSVKEFKIKFDKQPQDSGLYVVAALTLDNNYTTDFDIGTLTISPKKENVKLSFISNMPNKNHILELSEAKNFAFGGVCNEPDAQVYNLYVGVDYAGNPVISKTPIVNPGVYSETAYVLGGNYYADPITRGYVIKREAVTIEFDNEAIYDGEEINLNGVVKDSQGNPIANANIIYSYLGLDSYQFKGLPTDAGVYLVAATYVGDEYYGFATTANIVRVKKATPEIIVNEVNTVYNGKAVEASYSVPAYVKASDVSVTYYDANGNELTSKPVNAGKYTYTVTVAGSKNYFETTATGNIIIEKAPLSIVINNNEKIFNEADPKLTYTVTGLVEGEEIEVVVSREAGEDVGEYAITATYSNTENYKATVSEGVFTINKATPTITVEDIETVYNGKAVEANYSVPTYVKASDVSVTYYDANGNELTSKPVNAGKYTYTVTVAGSKNYFETTATGNIIIEKAPLSIVINNNEKIFDEADPKLTYTVTGLVEGEEIEVVVSREAGEDVGEYAITASYSNTENYKVTVSEGVFTINKATPTITVEDIEVVYNGETVEVKYQVPSYVDAKDITIKYFNASGEELTSAPSEVGEYTFIITINGISNYIGTSATGSISIKAANVNPGDNTSSNNPDGNQNNSSNTNTGDNVNLYVYACMLIISIGMLFIYQIKIKKSK